MKKVAIVQNRIIWGGRLDLITHLIRVLNERNIKPDIVTFRVPPGFSRESVRNMYGVDIEFNLRVILSHFSYLPAEFNLFAFNFMIRRICGDYELLLNSSNTDIFMPDHPTISYIHFPRKTRAQSPYESIHTFLPKKISIFRTRGLHHLFLRLIYAFNRQLPPRTKIVCNSEFTRNSFNRSYPRAQNDSVVSVIHPPYSGGEVPEIPIEQKKLQVVHVGRFSPDKFQKELIEFGASKPEFDFFLVGFAAENDRYYALCEETLRSTGAHNVYLKPNATSTDRDLLLRESLIYIHTTPFEPFGLGVLHGIVDGNCLTLVPNTGGQIEIVPFADLQFSNLEDLREKLRSIMSDKENLDRLRTKLLKRVKQFDFPSFRNKWNELLDQTL